MGKIEEKLKAYKISGNYPFHMPGHKQNNVSGAVMHADAAFAFDITEIDGFDNLHHATGMIREAQQRAASLYHAKKSYFLVNGSTCGILAAISAALPKGGKLLMARNSHKAAYHAAYLRELHTVYLYPQPTVSGIAGSINPGQVEAALQADQGIGAVFLTSPTYDGVASDVRAIADITKRYGRMLIVDAAHGAHFGFHPDFPESAVKSGADIVIMSMHKTLPAYTQSALLHSNMSGEMNRRLEQFLSIYETSSPSYVFMAQMDSCIDLLREQADGLFGSLSDRLAHFYTHARKLQLLNVYDEKDAAIDGIYQKDPSKILISTKSCGMDGKHLYDLLGREYRLQLEMYAGKYVTALTGIMDKKEGFNRLAEALSDIDKKYGSSEKNMPEAEKYQFFIQQLYKPQPVVMKLAEVDEYHSGELPLGELAGHVSAAYFLLYPPGIPFITPGERITEEQCSAMAGLLASGYTIEGLERRNGDWYGNVVAKISPYIQKS